MRDAALRALLDMYATSPRCLARATGRYGVNQTFSPSSRRLLSSHAACTLQQRRRPAHRNWRDPAAATTPTLPLATTTIPAYHVGDRRHYSAGVNTPRSIAVLGGGLTGLTTAWYLTRALPQAKITLYEASDRLGGWIDTQKVDVETPDGEKGTVHFERAARMIKPQTNSAPLPRYDDLVFYEMVANLNLAGELECSKGKPPVSGYIYYPDHLVPLRNIVFKPFTQPLATLQSFRNALEMLTEPLFRDLFPAMLNYFRTRGSQYGREIFHGKRDMSMGEYYAHRMGRETVDKIMSAGVHGITGGDIWKMSMASAPFPDLLMPPTEQPMTHVQIRRVDYEMMTQIIKDKATFDLATEYLDANALWFREGFNTLTNGLAEALRRNPNVTIKMSEPVSSVRYDGASDRVLITTNKNNTPAPYEKVVSTIFAKTLASVTDGHLPSLESSSAVTIQLVNLWYPTPFANAPYHAFGYLLPQALGFDRNPECVLGVIFDSDREFTLPTPENPTSTTNRGADTLHGTKLTVMLGGHYWDDLPESFLPDSQTAIDLAKRAVERHLGLDPSLTAQAVGTSKLCRDCLPQHVVGHPARMRAAHDELQWGFKGRLAVAGGSYQSPGVLPSVRAARDVAMQIAGAWQDQQGGGSLTVGETGLNRFDVGPPRYMTAERFMLPLRFRSGAFMDEDGVIQPGMVRGGQRKGGEEED